MSKTKKKAKVGKKSTVKRAVSKPKKVDFSFLKGFDFVPTVGNYPNKQVCIMSAAALATKISSGDCTLTEALELKQGNYGHEPKVEATDELSCVDPTLRTLLIARNDHPAVTDKARKPWALKMLPRILGTKSNLTTTRKVEALAVGLLEEMYNGEERRASLAEIGTLLKKAQAALKDKDVDAVESELDEAMEAIYYHPSPLDYDSVDSFSALWNEFTPAQLDTVIEKVLKELKK